MNDLTAHMHYAQKYLFTKRVVLFQGFVWFRYGKTVFVKCIYFLFCDFEMNLNRFTKWYAVMVLSPTKKRTGPMIYKQQLTADQFSHWKFIELYADKQIKLNSRKNCRLPPKDVA